MLKDLLSWRKLLACLHFLPTSLHLPGASTMAGILALVHLQHADRVDEARLPGRLVKDHQNPFAAYSEEEFIWRYRLSKECIHILLGQVALGLYGWRVRLVMSLLVLLLALLVVVDMFQTHIFELLSVLGHSSHLLLRPCPTLRPLTCKRHDATSQ
ncbi:hypothetical protein O3P69_005692 [Scylla paramamosain]|uniref:Uncharacterized protein n=1 Tax=Scylla paramamosain TaxID=85552 RepID=A0AAW0U7N5_SCYPA